MSTLFTAIFLLAVIPFFVFLFGQSKPALAMSCLAVTSAAFAVLAPLAVAAGAWIAAPMCAAIAVLGGSMVYRHTARSRRERRAVDRHRGDLDPDSSAYVRHEIAVDNMDGAL